MNINEIVQPNITGPPIQALTFYHGTPTTIKAESILRDGIQPGNITGRSRGHLTPVSGSTYLTADLKYAVVYALGAAVVGNGGAVDWIVKRSGDRFGYVFVIPGQALTGNIQPDEDYVGQFLDWFSTVDATTRERRFFRERTGADPQLNQIWNFIYNSITPLQRQRIFQGEYVAYASGGKRALKTMPAWMKTRLIQMGSHLSHQGPITPTQCWRIDKLRCGEINEDDANNFFDIAERVK